MLKKIILGSVAIEVIENTNNVVVAMPEEIFEFSHEKIFVAVTEKHSLNILALDNFLNFLDEGNTSIPFFNLAKPTEKTEAIEKKLMIYPNYLLTDTKQHLPYMKEKILSKKLRK